jgi:hypothetical protein
MTRASVTLAALVAAVTAAACSDNVLEVENRNNPSRGNVLALGRDVEALSSSLYRSVFSAHFGANDNLDNQLRPSALENASGLSNFGLSLRSAFPRSFADNAVGNTTAVGNYRDYRLLVTAAGTAATVLERVNATGFTLGDAAQDARAKSFAWFGHGVALGDIALAYDSTAIPRIGVTLADSLPLVSADSAMRTAIRSLDSALVYAATASAIPTEWLRTATTYSAGANGEYTRLIRSYRARFRAGVARSAAQRAAVDWNAVVADATAGITQDYAPELLPSAGWDHAWLRLQHFASVSWHQMTPYIIGFADSSGAYDAWLATPRESRNQILIVTADRRFPQGETRDAQRAQAPAPTFVNTNTQQYFRNRLGDDASGVTWINSQYDHNRWRALFNNSGIGRWVMFSKVENDMLAAEGYIRTNRIPQATALIDVSRTRNGLPALTGVVTTATQQVPGGQGCVPRIPNPAAGYTSTICGNVFEAMKWEKRMESAFTGWGQWYFDGRGWNDLPPGTPLEWAVPYQELLARATVAAPAKIYSLGGVGAASGAPNTNTYGFGTTGNL